MMQHLKIYQSKSLWVMPTTYLWTSALLLFHWQKQLSKSTVCYGDHLCGAEKKLHDSLKLPGKKKKNQGISFRSAAVRSMCWTLTEKLTVEDKSLGPGGGGGGWQGCGWGGLHKLGVLASSPVKEPCLIWTIVPRHLQTNASANQAFSSLHIHSSAAALTQKEKQQICFWWQPDPHLSNEKEKSLPMFNYYISPSHSGSFPQGETIWFRRGEMTKRPRSSQSVNEDTAMLLSDWQRCAINLCLKSASLGQHASSYPPPLLCKQSRSDMALLNSQTSQTYVPIFGSSEFHVCKWLCNLKRVRHNQAIYFLFFRKIRAIRICVSVMSLGCIKSYKAIKTSRWVDHWVFSTRFVELTS